MTLKNLTVEEAQDRLEWLCGLAGVKLIDLCLPEHGDDEFLDPIPDEAVELLHEMSRVSATVAKHYDIRAGRR